MRKSKCKLLVYICLLLVLNCPQISGKETVVMLTTNTKMQLVADKYNSRQNNIHLEIKISSLEKGMVTGAVDLVNVYNINISDAAGILLSLDNYLRSDSKLQSKQMQLRETMPYKHIYAIPIERNQLTVFAHSYTFKKTGMAPITKWTWDEFYEWATRIAASRIHYYGTVLPISAWTIPFMQLGGNMQGPFGLAEYGLRMIKKIYQTPGTHLPVDDSNRFGNPFSFITGEAASSISTLNHADILRQYGYKPGVDGWRTIPLPNVDKGQQVGVSMKNTSIGITVTSRKKDQAWSVLRWLMLEEGAATLMATGMVPYTIYPSMLVDLQNNYGATSKDVFPFDVYTLITPFIDPEHSTVNISNKYIIDYYNGLITVQEAIAGMNASVS